MDHEYNRVNPNPASQTEMGDMNGKMMETMSKLALTRSLVAHSKNEKMMLLAFIFSVVQDFNCFLSDAVTKAAAIFRWYRGNIFKVVADYLESPDSALAPKIHTKRGRGSAEFIRR